MPAFTVPLHAGIALKHEHVPRVLDEGPPVAWFEVHSENYLSAGGPHIAALERIRRDYPLSCHGVGLSLGSAAGIDDAHLRRLKLMITRFAPALVSEHLSWSVAGGTYFNDLLPLPYSQEALEIYCRNLDHAQAVLGRRMLIENPSTYLQYSLSTMTEAEFLTEVVRRTGCGLLLDVNNIHVTASNHEFDPIAMIDAIPAAAVEEIHIAGHSVEWCEGELILIDDHGSTVDPAVWNLLHHTLDQIGPRPILIEWDTRVPELPVLMAEAHTAERAIARCERTRALAEATHAA